MSKLVAVLVAAGFTLGLDCAVAQNVDSDKDRLNYTQMRERCSTFSNGQDREECLANAHARYLTSAALRCEQLIDRSMKQQCFNDVQAALAPGLPTTGPAATSTSATTAGGPSNQGDAVKRGGDEDKAGRQ